MLWTKGSPIGCRAKILANKSISQGAILLRAPTLQHQTRGDARRQLTRQIHSVTVLGLPRDAGLSLPYDRDLETPLPGFDNIAESLEDLAAGKFLVVLDDENRENEGDLIIAADRVTAPAMAFMVEHTSGVICIGMEGKDLDRLRLPLMINSAENEVSP